MISYPDANAEVALNRAIPVALASLESIVRTEELRTRPRRPVEYEKETVALAALVKALADSPRTILQTLTDKILEVLQSDSAGLSLLTKDGQRFYWPAVSGVWKPHLRMATSSTVAGRCFSDIPSCVIPIFGPRLRYPLRSFSFLST